MFTTYKSMQSYTNDELLNRELDDLVTEYKSTDDARRKNKLIATIFCKVYPLILKLQKKFYSLTPEQKIEHVLMHLITCLQAFNRDGKRKNKFITFFQHHIQNKLQSLYRDENLQKRAVFQNIVKNNAEVMDDYNKVTADKDYELSNRYFINNLVASTFLSSEEKEYCLALLAGFNNSKDISKVLKLEERYNLKRVTNPLVVMEKSKEQELDEQASMRRIRDIRTSIREKIKKYGDKIFA